MQGNVTTTSLSIHTCGNTEAFELVTPNRCDFKYDFKSSHWHGSLARASRRRWPPAGPGSLVLAAAASDSGWPGPGTELLTEAVTSRHESAA